MNIHLIVNAVKLMKKYWTMCCNKWDTSFKFSLWRLLWNKKPLVSEKSSAGIDMRP
jgi:hypothetical protein